MFFLGLAFAPWRLFVNAFTRYLGKISYSIYLNHTTVVNFLSPVYLWLYQHSVNVTVAFLASAALTYAIVCRSRI